LEEKNMEPKKPPRFLKLLRQLLLVASILMIIIGVIDKGLYSLLMWMNIIETNVENILAEFALGYFTFCFGASGILIAVKPYCYKFNLIFFSFGNIAIIVVYLYRGIIFIKNEETFPKVAGSLLIIFSAFTSPNIVLMLLISMNKENFKVAVEQITKTQETTQKNEANENQAILQSESQAIRPENNSTD
jgi:hypothetical protein